MANRTAKHVPITVTAGTIAAITGKASGYYQLSKDGVVFYDLTETPTGSGAYHSGINAVPEGLYDVYANSAIIGTNVVGDLDKDGIQNKSITLPKFADGTEAKQIVQWSGSLWEKKSLLQAGIAGLASNTFTDDQTIQKSGIARFIAESTGNHAGYITDAATGFMPYISMQINSATKWFLAVDPTDDKFKLATSSNLAADTKFMLDSSGNISTNGYVGIGNNNPQRSLHITKDGTGSPTFIALENINTSNNNAVITSHRTTTTGIGASSFVEMAGIKTVFSEHDHATRTSKILFFNTGEGTPRNVLSIAGDGTSGKVGINKESPSTELDVVGGGAFTGDVTCGGDILIGENVLKTFINRPTLWGDTDGTFIRSVDNDTGNGIKFESLAGSRLVTILDSGNVGINTTTPDEKLHVAGNITAVGATLSGLSNGIVQSTSGVLSSGDITASQITDVYPVANGTATKDTLRWGGSGWIVSDVIWADPATPFNVALGINAMDNASGIYNIAIGSNALSLHNADRCIGIGRFALLDNSGYQNIGLGAYSCRENTGYNNIGIGIYAAQDNSGDHCVSLGQESLRDNSGNYCVAAGYQALKNNAGQTCSGIGYRTLELNTGDYCIGIGDAALYNNSGANCIGIGYSALMNNAQPHQFELLNADSHARALLRGDFQTGHLWLPRDNAALYFGYAKDAFMYYDGVNFVINPHAVGTGGVTIRTSPGKGGLTLFPSSAAPSAAEGKIYYDSTANKLKFFNGVSWETITSA